MAMDYAVIPQGSAHRFGHAPERHGASLLQGSAALMYLQRVPTSKTLCLCCSFLLCVCVCVCVCAQCACAPVSAPLHCSTSRERVPFWACTREAWGVPPAREGFQRARPEVPASSRTFRYSNRWRGHRHMYLQYNSCTVNMSYVARKLSYVVEKLTSALSVTVRDGTVIVTCTCSTTVDMSICHMWLITYHIKSAKQKQPACHWKRWRGHRHMYLQYNSCTVNMSYVAHKLSHIIKKKPAPLPVTVRDGAVVVTCTCSTTVVLSICHMWLMTYHR